MRDEAKANTSKFARPSRTEFEFTNQIRKQALSLRHKLSPLPDPSLVFGIGDDAAVFRQRPGRETVITADLLVEDIDFRLSTTTAWLLGHKALAVSLSDIAAMGALPRYSLLSIGVPAAVWKSSFIDQLYEGYFGLAEIYNVALIGGDVSRSPERVVIDSIVLGEVARGRAVRRSGARPGDHIFITGSLGGAATGLRLLKQGAQLRTRGKGTKDSNALDQILLRQLRPEPRVAWGLALGKERLATSMIDISDGLSSDLGHLCSESTIGARIDAARIPIDASVIKACKQLGTEPLHMALDGGEDFELLFTVRPRDLKRLPREIDGVPATYVGDVTAESGQVLLADGSSVRELAPGGFTHF